MGVVHQACARKHKTSLGAVPVGWLLLLLGAGFNAWLLRDDLLDSKAFAYLQSWHCHRWGLARASLAGYVQSWTLHGCIRHGHGVSCQWGCTTLIHMPMLCIFKVLMTCACVVLCLRVCHIQELECYQHLSHTHIVGYIGNDFDTASNCLYIFLEYVPGRQCVGTHSCT